MYKQKDVTLFIVINFNPAIFQIVCFKYCEMLSCDNIIVRWLN